MPNNYKIILGGRSYLNYRNENLQKAIRAIKLQKLSIREASERYGVPRSTISDKLRNIHGKKHGGQAILSELEEAKIAEAIATCAEWGFPFTELDIRKLVQHYFNRKEVTTRFKNNMPGRIWSKKFLARHENLTVRLAQNIKRD